MGASSTISLCRHAGGHNRSSQTGDEFRGGERSLPPSTKGSALPLRPHPEPGTGVMVIGAVTRADVPMLCERLRLLVDESNVDVVDCDVRALGADVVAVEALAHLRLTARRAGCHIRLRRLSHELEGLLDLCGLNEVLPTCGLRLG